MYVKLTSNGLRGSAVSIMTLDEELLGSIYGKTNLGKKLWSKCSKGP